MTNTKQIFTESFRDHPNIAHTVILSNRELMEKLDHAHDLGYAKGMDAGIEHARITDEGIRSAFLLDLQESLPNLFMQQFRDFEQCTIMAMRIATSILAKTIPTTLGDLDPTTLLKAQVEEAITKAKPSGTLRLKLHPNRKAVAQELLAQIPLIEGTSITAIEDATLDPLDLRLEWSDGGLLMTLSNYFNALTHMTEEVNHDGRQ